MSNKIVAYKENEELMMIVPAPDFKGDISSLAPDDAEWYIFNKNDVPKIRTMREAFDIEHKLDGSGAKIIINGEKAKDITRKRIEKESRAFILGLTEIERRLQRESIMSGDEQKYKDFFQNVVSMAENAHNDRRISEAQTVEELEKIDPIAEIEGSNLQDYI